MFQKLRDLLGRARCKIGDHDWTWTPEVTLSTWSRAKNKMIFNDSETCERCLARRVWRGPYQ